MLLWLTLALLFDSKSARQCIMRDDLPRAVDVYARFPLCFAPAVVVTLVVIVIGKADHHVKAPGRIVNEFHAVRVMFMAIPVRRGVWWRPVSMTGA